MGGTIWKCLRYRSLVLASFSCGLCALGSDASVNPLGCLFGEGGGGGGEKEMRWMFYIYPTTSSYFTCRLITMTQRFFLLFFLALVFAVRYMYYWCCVARVVFLFLFPFYIRAGFYFIL